MKYLKKFESDIWKSTNPVRWIDPELISDILTELIDEFGDKEVDKRLYVINKNRKRVQASIYIRVDKDNKEEEKKLVDIVNRCLSRFRNFFGETARVQMFKNSPYQKDTYMVVFKIPNSETKALIESLSEYSKGLITKLTYDQFERMITVNDDIEEVTESDIDKIKKKLSKPKEVKKVKRYEYDNIKCGVSIDYDFGYIILYKFSDGWWTIEVEEEINRNKMRPTKKWSHWLVDGFDGMEEWFNNIFPELSLMNPLNENLTMNNSIVATDSLTTSDMETISDILLELSDKWDMSIFINQPINRWDDTIEIKKFSGFFIELNIRKAKFKSESPMEYVSMFKEFEDDLFKALIRLKKFGYDLSGGPNYGDFRRYCYFYQISKKYF